ncbi:MAG TPA: hypothetical protein VLR26_17270 [Frankiaceae bacterium]|nr:hypothetical protein [Frankiaceae bacterium]
MLGTTTLRTNSTRLRISVVGGALAVSAIGGVLPAHADDLDDQPWPSLSSSATRSSPALPVRTRPPAPD